MIEAVGGAISSLASGSFGAVIAVIGDRYFLGQARRDKQREEEQRIMLQMQLMQESLQEMNQTMRDLSGALREHAKEMAMEFRRRDDQMLIMEREIARMSGAARQA